MNKKIIIGIVLFLIIVLLIVGFSTTTAEQLDINDNTISEEDLKNFKFGFIGTPETSDGEKAVATINEEEPTKATIDVSGLKEKNDFVTATFTIKNNSENLSASLSAMVENTNREYFKVEHNIEQPSTLKIGETTTITVKITLTKTPEEIQPETTATVTITADPIQQ